MVMGYEIRKTPEFDKWLKGIRDVKAIAAILVRIDRAGIGNFGDSDPVGEGVSEIRVFVGKGYRAYYTIKGGEIIWLLCDGTKSNKKAQQADIAKARKLAKEV